MKKKLRLWILRKLKACPMESIPLDIKNQLLISWSSRAADSIYSKSLINSFKAPYTEDN